MINAIFMHGYSDIVTISIIYSKELLFQKMNLISMFRKKGLTQKIKPNKNNGAHNFKKLKMYY